MDGDARIVPAPGSSRPHWCGDLVRLGVGLVRPGADPLLPCVGVLVVLAVELLMVVDVPDGAVVEVGGTDAEVLPAVGTAPLDPVVRVRLVDMTPFTAGSVLCTEPTSCVADVDLGELDGLEGTESLTSWVVECAGATSSGRSNVGPPTAELSRTTT